jgi:hypothetical protein
VPVSDVVNGSSENHFASSNWRRRLVGKTSYIFIHQSPRTYNNGIIGTMKIRYRMLLFRTKGEGFRYTIKIAWIFLARADFQLLHTSDLFILKFSQKEITSKKISPVYIYMLKHSMNPQTL